MCQKVDAGGLLLLNSPNKDLNPRKNHNVFKHKLKANTFRNAINIFLCIVSSIHQFMLGFLLITEKLLRGVLFNK